MFVFLWSGFTYLDLGDWEETKKGWSRRPGMEGETESVRTEEDGDRKTLDKTLGGASAHPKSPCPPAASISFIQTWPQLVVGAGAEPNAVRGRSEGFGVPAFRGLSAHQEKWAYNHFKARSADPCVRGSIGSKARVGLLVLMPGGILGSRTPRASLKSRPFVPPPLI